MKNNYYLNCKKVDTAIRRAKNMLVEYAKKHGIYECFGQKQVMEIKDKFVVLNDYSKEMNMIRMIALGRFLELSFLLFELHG